MLSNEINHKKCCIQQYFFFHNTLLVLVITQKESKSVECNAFYLQCAFKEI